MKGEGLFSWAIRLRSEWSHVVTLMRLLIGSRERILIAEAVYPRGVVFEWASEYIRRYRGTIWWVPLKHDLLAEKSPGYQTRIINFLAGESGADHEPRKPYDLRGVLSYAVPFIRQRKAAYYCSELSATAFRNEQWLQRTDYDPEELIRQWMCQEPVEVTHES